MIEDRTIIISCAGIGSRLKKNMPKCLVDIDGKKIIERQLEQLKNVKNIIVIVGYKKEKVIEFVSNIRKDIKFCTNDDYENTGTGTSYFIGVENSNTKYVTSLDGDLLVDPVSMKEILEIDEEFICGEEKTTDQPMLMCLNDKKEVIEFSRDKGELEWSGISNIKREKILEPGWHVCSVLTNLLPIKSMKINAKEIDTPNDLEEAIRWVKNNYDR